MPPELIDQLLREIRTEVRTTSTLLDSFEAKTGANFARIDAHFDRIEKRFESFEATASRIRKRLESFEATASRIESSKGATSSFDSLERSVAAGFAAMKDHLDRLRADLETTGT